MLYIHGVPYHNDKPWTWDKPVYDGPEPIFFFFFNKSYSFWIILVHLLKMVEIPTLNNETLWLQISIFNVSNFCYAIQNNPAIDDNSK